MLTKQDFINYMEKTYNFSDGLLFGFKDVGDICQFFITVEPIFGDDWAVHSDEYWEWCSANLTGKTFCFFSDSDNKVEWWGFTNEQDIMWWKLKWA